MAWKIEGRDIVISGFEEGIADSPYQGVADMRNVETINIPGEASVQYAMASATLPPVINDKAFTADSSTNRLTWDGSVAGLYEGCAISLDIPVSEFDIDNLAVAGGGGGGGGDDTGGQSGGGGGGAGGAIEDTYALESGTYAVTIGAGGAGGTVPGNQGTDGGNTVVAGVVTVTGGGGGGGQDGKGNGKNGGSGGGSGLNGTPGTGVAGQGFVGGISFSGGGGVAGSGGGGGATQAGNAGAENVGGAGGNGLSSSISGSSVTYGGGGGAGANEAGVPGNGGTGGGGNGGALGADGSAGTTNRGGGGGGGGDDNGGAGRVGGAGGSGIAIFSYPTGDVVATGGTITTSGGNTIHTFTTSGNFSITAGLEPDTVYYVRNIVGNTFQISLAPQGSILDIPGGGELAGTFTTYQYGNQLASASPVGTPRAYFVDRRSLNGVCNGIYLVDSSAYGWAIYPVVAGAIPANSLVFLGNIEGASALSPANEGIFLWKGYVFIVTSFLEPMNLEDWWTLGPSASWFPLWENISSFATNNKISSLVDQDDKVFFTSSVGVGLLEEATNQTFDPSNSATYNVDDEILALPSNDRATCLGQLGTNLLIGGLLQYIYPWDRTSATYNYPIYVPDPYTINIIGTNQNAYIFSGNRGRIYITNGSSIDLFKKVPDYLTGGMNPYIRWWDASYNRNQLYFTFTATSNADVALETTNGAWSIDLKSNSLRMVNKISNSGYSGVCRMAVEMPPASQSDNPAGSSMTLGWNVSTTYRIDVGSESPYLNYESFVETEMIPIGTFINPYTPTQLEWKTSTPLVSGEGVKIYFRTNLSQSFTSVGESTTAGAISDLYKANFQKAQWVQFRIEIKSTASSPSYTRLTEIRIREIPQ